MPPMLHMAPAPHLSPCLTQACEYGRMLAYAEVVIGAPYRYFTGIALVAVERW